MKEIKGNFLLNLTKRDNSLEEYHFNEFEEQINEIVTDEEFKERVLTELQIIKEYGKNKWSKNEVVGTLKGMNYKTTIKVGNNRVYYSVMTDDVFFRGSLHKINDRQVIQYMDSKRISEEVMNDNMLDNIVTTTSTDSKTIIVDENGNKRRESKTKQENRYRIKKTDLDKKYQVILEHNDIKKYSK